jgi:hypothetical protein
MKIATITAAVILSAVWLKLSAALDWNIYGTAGIAFGLLAGIPLCVGNWADRRFTFGSIAAAIAVVAILVAQYRDQDSRRERIQSAITDDKSFIAAIAEQKMLHRSPAFGVRAGTGEDLSEGVPLVVESDRIPEDILREATAEWNSLPENAKNTIRQRRVEVTQESFGNDFEGAAIPAPWTLKLRMISFAGLLAFATAAAPAMMAIKR